MKTATRKPETPSTTEDQPHRAGRQHAEHEYTNYETLLLEMPHSRNAVTNTLIYLTVKSNVNNLIAQTVPELAQACQAQIDTARDQVMAVLQFSRTAENPFTLLN